MQIYYNMHPIFYYFIDFFFSKSDIRYVHTALNAVCWSILPFYTNLISLTPYEEIMLA